MHHVKFTITRIVFLFLFILLFIEPSFAQIQKDTTLPTKQILTDSSISISDTFRNPFVKMYQYGNTTKADSLTKNASTSKKNQKGKKVDTTHYSPKKAALWALGFPGLGQIYNKKYWKLPIVYAVIGTVTYFVASNGIKLNQFNGYLTNSYNGVENPAPYNTLSLSQIESIRNGYRRNVQIASFGTLLAWGLSIVDATVDAHLRTFDISDKLTLHMNPQLNYANLTYYAGITVNLGFK